MKHLVFQSRKEAGRLLAGRLASRGYLEPVVLVLSSGGVLVGFEVARALGARLDALDAPDEASAARIALGIDAPEPGPGRLRRDGRPPVPVECRTAIVVDDGGAAGGSLRAALAALRRRRPKRIVLAVPVLSDAVLELAPAADDVVCLLRLAGSESLAGFYQDFREVTDAEAAALLERETAAAPDPR